MEVETEKRGRTLIVALNRPERRNAVDSKTASLLANSFEQFDADSQLDVAVLTGYGGTFCAGFDLKEFANTNVDRLPQEGNSPMGPTRMRLSKPVIAAIEGYAVAGGMELALWCDLRVAARTAVMGIFCRRFGVPLVDLGTTRLPRLIGQSRALDLILTGRPVSADEAYTMGLVNRVAEPGEALAMSIKLAEEMSAFPQTCMRNDRLSVLEQWDLNEAEAIANELKRGRQTLMSGEAKAGATAFDAGKGRHGRFS
jgi:enoyl-CoA hydratase